jgi:hypothetical protein
MPLEQVGARRVGAHTGGIRQKYFLDEPGRALILAKYDGTKPVIDELAARLHVPRYVVKKWGCQLGLARQKEPFWTRAEEEYLEANLGRASIATIAKTLGRTQIAVKLKAKRLGVNKTAEGYTMRGLCLALGCDHHKVERWLRDGWIVGRRRETEKEKNDYWLFTDGQIRDFVLAHPLEIDPRRMDWLWMVSLLSGGPGTLLSQESRPQRGDDMYIDVERALTIDIDSLAGKNIAVLGITRSGKTNTALVLVEELLSNQTPVTIVDIEGEYRGLKERFTMLVAGRSNADILLTAETAAELAKDSVEQGSNVLLDLSEYTEQEAHEILLNYFTCVWNLTTKRKSPYQIVLEEAHEWVPEGTRTPLKTLLIRIALRGRKRGLGLMLVSQRSAKVSKDALSQCNVLFLHKVIHPVDRAIYKSFIPLPGTEVDRMISDLQVGHAIIMAAEQLPRVAQIRPHGSKLVQLDIKTMLRKRIKELEEQVAEQEQFIREQADYIAQLTELHPERVG